MNFAHSFARLRIRCSGSDRARVQHDQICAVPVATVGQSSAQKIAANGRSICVGRATAEIFDIESFHWR